MQHSFENRNGSAVRLKKLEPTPFLGLISSCAFSGLLLLVNKRLHDPYLQESLLADVATWGSHPGSCRRTFPWCRDEAADDGSERHDTEREEHKLSRNCDADDEGDHVVDEVAELLAEDIVHMQQDIYAHP
jgi:hypothetical protein